MTVDDETFTPGELRRALRAYVRWTLYADVPGRTSPPALTLPRLTPAAVEDADVYAARPGSDDPPLDEEGQPLPRPFQGRQGVTILARGPNARDPVGLQAGHADSWRRYLEDEVANRPAMVLFERATVRSLVQRLSPRDQQAVWDIAHLTGKEAARQHHCSVAAVKLAARDALDRLLTLLYASTSRRSA